MGGDAAALALTPEAIALWLRARFRDGARPDDRRPWALRTAHRQRAVLRTFYAWVERAGLIADNPVDQVRLPRPIRSRPRVVDSETVDRMFAYVERQIRDLTRSDPRHAALYVLDAAVLRLMDRLALRVSEASGIRLSAVGPGRGPDRVSEVRALVWKKGGKPKEYPLTGVVLTAYVRWLRIRATVTPRPGHEDAIFIHPWTGHRVSRQRAWQRLKRLAAEAGLRRDVVRLISPHKLRHSCARRMLDEGWDLAAVQAVLDHANIATTSIYLEDDERTRLHTLRALSQ